MGNIKVADAVHDQISLLAMAWNTSDGEVVRRLLEDYRRARQAQAQALPEGGIPVHAVYDGIQTEGVYLQGGGRLQITSGVLAGKTFKSPSGAAIAIVRAHNPEVNPNRNGWKFWTVTDTRQPLESLRPAGGSS